MLRVFPGASSSVAGISNQPQQFYPNTHLHNNNNHRFPLQAHFRQSPHLQGFANSPTHFNTNTPASDDANMMDVQLGSQMPIV
jgi:hypothetical protein